MYHPAVIGKNCTAILALLQCTNLGVLGGVTPVAFASLAEILRQTDYRPDLVFVSDLPNTEQINRLQQRFPQAHVVAVVDSDQPATILAALQAGTVGCMPSRIGLFDFLYTLDHFTQGGFFITAPSLAQLVVWLHRYPALASGLDQARLQHFWPNDSLLD